MSLTYNQAAIVANLTGCSIDDVEKHLLLATLRATGGSRAITARMLGCTRQTVRNMMRRYRITFPYSRSPAA